MTPPTPPPPKTLLGQMTQVVKQVHAKVDFSKLRLRPNAKVAELRVQEPNAETVKTWHLLGDRYIFGRSSSCDIQIHSGIVSQVHGSLSRDHQQTRFIIRDENSTNGIFRGKRRIRKAILYHNDTLTLGPPDLADAVQIRYYNPPPTHVRLFRTGLYSITGLFAVIALYLGAEWLSTPVDLQRVPAPGPVVVYARDGQTLNTVRSDTHRDLPRLSDFSRYLPKAVVASEDSRYYWHLGIDPLGVVRAAFFTLRGVQREGASTITQQVARSLFREQVGTDDSIRRKIREAIVALKLEMLYGKDRILLTYLNRVYLGSGNYGFEDAAQFYFDKPAKQLTLSEAATLVAMLPAPNNFNPVNDLKTAEGLRNRVINRMADLRMISSEEARQGLLTIIQVSPKAREALQKENSLAPYFYDYIFSELQAKSPYLAQQGNLIIETSLDPKMQAEADRALKQTIAENGAAAGIEQGAIVTLDAKTGEILAMTGGVDYQKSQFNRAAQAARQPGSTFKIFTYAAALEQGIPPSATYACTTLNWSGQTFAGCRSGSGSMDMWQGMALSENVIALRIAQDVGLPKVIQTARRLGIQSPLRSSPGLVLGESEVTPLEITGAFAVLANQGTAQPPHAIRRIFDGATCAQRNDPQTCRLIYDHARDPVRATPVLSPNIADTMTQLLEGVVQAGTGQTAALSIATVAGKTGTTNDNADLWFIGYVPSRSLVTGVWLGNDDPTPTNGSSALAAALWGTYMGRVVK